MTNKRRTNYISEEKVEFSDWIRTELPQHDFYVTDIDYQIRSKKGCIILLETKCRMSEVKTAQYISLQIAHRAYLAINNTTFNITMSNYNLEVTISYKGLHLLQFENTSPKNGKIFFDCKEISEQELIDILSFADCPECL